MVVIDTFLNRRWGPFSIDAKCVPLSIMRPAQLGNARVKVMTPTTNPSSSIVSAVADRHAIAKLVTHWFGLSVCRVLAYAAPATPRRQLEFSGLDRQKHYEQLEWVSRLDYFIDTASKPLASAQLWDSGTWVGLGIVFLAVKWTNVHCASLLIEFH